MTKLTKALETARKDGQLISYPVVNSAIIYKGAAVFLSASGTGTTGSNVYTNDETVMSITTGDSFVGIAHETADNTVAGHTTGGVSVRVGTMGEYLMPFSDTLTADKLGLPVYVTPACYDSVVSVTADTASGHNQVIIGYITKVVTTGAGTSTAYVRIDQAINNLVTHTA